MRIAIIGCNVMGANFADVFVNEIRHTPSDIICYDINRSKAREVADKYGVQIADTLPLDAEAAILTSGTASHAKVITELAKGRVRYLLCKKLLALDTKQVEEIRNAGIPHVVTARVTDFSPAIGAVSALMAQEHCSLLEGHGRWQKPRLLNPARGPSTGAFVDAGIYAVSGLLQLAKAAGGGRNKPLRWVRSIGRIPFTDPTLQQAAHKRDEGYPLNPSHTVELKLVVNGVLNAIPLSVDCSLLAAEKIRSIEGVAGRDGIPIFSFAIRFDEELNGRTVDVLTIARFDKRTLEQRHLPVDNLTELASAFLALAEGGAPDARLYGIDDEQFFVETAMATR